MEDVRNKYVPPSVSETAFNCPHCGTLAKQYWFSCHADPMKKDAVPRLFDAVTIRDIDLTVFDDANVRRKHEVWLERMAEGRPFLHYNRRTTDFDLENLFVSECYNCNQVAVWMYDRLMWPHHGTAPFPSADLPVGARGDYEEASTILDLSPRGAAALLRLSIQKLCEHLGEPGKNINDDIQALVAKGLDVRVQQALDVVRVVGNNAVHPGQIDLKDDRTTAEKLFGLVNLIAEIMISQPNHIKSMYDGLPASAREAIEQRDKKD